MRLVPFDHLLHLAPRLDFRLLQRLLPLCRGSLPILLRHQQLRSLPCLLPRALLRLRGETGLFLLANIARRLRSFLTRTGRDACATPTPEDCPVAPIGWAGGATDSDGSPEAGRTCLPPRAVGGARCGPGSTPTSDIEIGHGGATGGIK
eukprot:scaffold7923_cov121-Isochrysis_galbana.AAC.8